MDYQKLMAARMAQLAPSATLRINALAKELQSQGKPVLSFATGEPDFPTPPQIIAAAEVAMRSGKTKYTATPGIPELRRAVADRFRRNYQVDYEPAEIIIGAGGKQELYNLCQVILNPGDEVIIFSPYWVSYPEMVKLAGGIPVIVEGGIETGFVPTLAAVEAAITKRTKAIIVNSPNNPTGAVYPRDYLQALGQLAVNYNLLLVSDEIYDDLVYDGAHTCIAALSPEIRERTITIGGVSKSFSMTGWRLGWAAGPAPIIKAMTDLQSHSTSNPSSISQYAVLAGLTQDIPELAMMQAAFRRRRDLMFEQLARVKGFSLILPQGAFYLFIDLRQTPGYTTSEEFCAQLLSEQLVAAVPGEAFGAPGYFRLSYATAESDIIEGCRRIAEFIARR